MLWWGKLNDRALGSTMYRWKKLSPEEHVVGARAMAVVVHVRNPLDSLTTAQLEAIFSGRASDWRVFGGGQSPIRCYGPASWDPVMRLFREKLPSSRRGSMVRKRNSSEVLAAVASDPDAIAVVDAAAVASPGESAKKLSIDGALPNAQTIKEGTYPLAETLVLYVSPNASDEAKEFVQFILSGRGDAVLRECGLMPALREVRASAAAGFQRLYGSDIERVKATQTPDDDLELAGELLRTAGTMKLGPETVGAMCETAYDLAFDTSGGETLAFKALHVLLEKLPDREFDCAMKRVALYRRAYAAGKSRARGENLIDALMSAADTATEFRRHAEAADLWRRARAVAGEIESAEQEAIERRLPAFAARVKSEREARRPSRRA